MRVYNEISETIGNTPQLRITKLDHGEAEIFVKLEAKNPGGSVKDRIALSMIESAEKAGKLHPGMTIVEPTSGNTGIAVAMIGASRGYHVIICMPESMSMERRQILKAYGARLELTPAAQGMKAALQKAEDLLQELGDQGLMLAQFDNPANPEIHRQTTAQEILRDNDAKVDIFIAGVGTGGTITGVGEVLKKEIPGVQIIAVEPKESAVLSGGPSGPHLIQGIGAGFIPSVYRAEVVDEVIQVRGQDAVETARKLARTEGILAGISSGAALFAAIEVSKRPASKGKRIVVILPDTGERYLSNPVYADL